MATNPYASTPTCLTIKGVRKKLIATLVEKATPADMRLIAVFLLSIFFHHHCYIHIYIIRKRSFFSAHSTLSKQAAICAGMTTATLISSSN